MINFIKQIRISKDTVTWLSNALLTVLEEVIVGIGILILNTPISFFWAGIIFIPFTLIILFMFGEIPAVFIHRQILSLTFADMIALKPAFIYGFWIAFWGTYLNRLCIAYLVKMRNTISTKRLGVHLRPINSIISTDNTCNE